MSLSVRHFAASCRHAWPWLVLLGLCAVLLMQRGAWPQVIAYPGGWTLPIAEGVNVVMDAIVETARDAPASSPRA